MKSYRKEARPRINSTNLKRNFAKYVVLHRFTIANYRSMFLNAIW